MTSSERWRNMKPREICFNRRQFCTAIAGSFMPFSSNRFIRPSPGQSSWAVTQDESGFALHSPFDHPFYHWPHTLLSYRVDVSGTSSSVDELICLETGERVPCQISPRKTSDGHNHEAELLFFTDLPAGTTRTYRRYVGAAGSPASGAARIRVVHEGNRFTIDCGDIQVRIPASQKVLAEAPGPLLEFCCNGKWSGASTLKIAGHPIASLETSQLEDGPLRSTYRIVYITRTDHKYIATVQCVAGSDFVRLQEDMEYLPADAWGQFDFAWTGCDFNYRESPNHPFNFPHAAEKSYGDYPWETIAPVRMDNQFGVASGVDLNGKLPFSLLLYEPWTDVLAASFANFWSDKAPFAAAVFIDRPNQWEDHEYAIWHSSTRLAVDFIYKQPTLHFVWKIANGTRSTCISFYDHAKDIEAMTQLVLLGKGMRSSEGATYKSSIFATSHALNLQNWYGTLNLDKVKGWSLSYSENASLPKQVFSVAPWKNADEFYRTVDQAEIVTQLALSGVRQSHGFGPTGSRVILDDWIAGYQVFRSQLSAQQQKHIEGVYLLMAYVHADEDYMPTQRMLSGHPNFLSDVKSVPPGMTFLFPDHPAADIWADEWEAYLTLNTRYHTRPAVAQWNAKGGRWTENLGTYVWAFLKPALRADFLLKCRDGYERFSSPQLASLGDWLVNALTAPFAGETAATMKMISEQSAHNAGAKRHYWGIVSPADGPRRLHPPLGAHSDRRKTPRAMWYMGNALKDYNPIIAEHLMWAARPTDQDMETPLDDVDPYAVMYKQPDNRGTNPHLRSAKYTGYGLTLRAAVDTPQELSIHLVQIDDGPNYRWGNGSEGTCGIIYFYAAGKGYSHNGTEDAGDRIDQDTDFASNFGVWKNGAFCSIGQNVLSRPFYDLSFAQFAEICSRPGTDTYSWPEYMSRNILLAGDDYFIIFDKVFNPQVAHRFSWFVRKGDAFPHITLLTGNPNSESEHFTSIETDTTSGRWAEGMGDSIILITHKENIRPERTPFGGRVHTGEGSDFIFISSKKIEFYEGRTAFSGTSGIIRNRKDVWEMALFHGASIAAAGVSLTTQDTDLGISAKLTEGGLPSGHYFAPLLSEVTIKFSQLPKEVSLYIDGDKMATTLNADQFTVKLPAGQHCWELTTGLPVPLAPSVNRTESLNSGAIVKVIPVASATAYELELSTDNAATWNSCGNSDGPIFRLDGLENGKKYHVRLTATNSEHRSSPGLEYPLYISQHPPSAPNGLQVELLSGAAILTWGKVLGVVEFRLYRKKRGETSFQKVYSGIAATWKDTDPAIVPSHASPADSARKINVVDAPACEYYVTAISHNGESRPSRISNTNPSSWRNWDPTHGERFRRTVERTGSHLPNDGIGRYYPE